MKEYLFSMNVLLQKFFKQFTMESLLMLKSSISDYLYIVNKNVKNETIFV